jgi:hypothetical protein
MFCLRKWNIARDARCDAGHGLEAIIRKLFSEAMRGDVSSADKLLKMREHAETHGDIGPTVIKIGIPWSVAKNL